MSSIFDHTIRIYFQDVPTSLSIILYEKQQVKLFYHSLKYHNIKTLLIVPLTGLKTSLTYLMITRTMTPTFKVNVTNMKRKSTIIEGGMQVF